MAGEEQAPEKGRQRLDKWLFFTRLVKSRALAQKRISDGDIALNGQIVTQASQTVRIGDRLSLASWYGIQRRIVTIIVLAPGDRRGPFEEARLLYDVVGTTEEG